MCGCRVLSMSGNARNVKPCGGKNHGARSMALVIKGWSEYQHYDPTKRTILWIKVYKKLLDDPEWHALDPQTAKVLVMLWLLASETNGVLPSVEKIAFRLRLTKTTIESTISKLSHWVRQDDSVLLAKGYQFACLELEKELEKEKELEAIRCSAKAEACTLLEFLNEKTGKSFQPFIGGNGSQRPSSALELILNRLNDGHTSQNIRGVIARKSREWREDDKMRSFLRPKTLFSKQNFENYLGEREREGS